jgi:hypothetical protein
MNAAKWKRKKKRKSLMGAGKQLSQRPIKTK